MSAKKNVALFELMMHDELFREAFMDNPDKAVNESNPDLSPLEAKMLLVVRDEDLEQPASLKDEYSGPRLCLDGIGCTAGENRPKPKPPS